MTVLSRLLKSNLLKNALFAGTIFWASEITQQTLVGDDKYDFGHITRVALTGLLFYGPFCYGFYRILDKTWPGVARQTILKKLALDQAIAGPVSIAGFYVGMSILERKEDIFREAKQKTLPSWGACLIFWPPIQIINFKYVPPQYRVVYVSVLTYVWANFLCFMKERHGLHGERGFAGASDSVSVVLAANPKSPS
ncbi:mpv17-like protein [Ptychodera flava]|uniref:mpv17-like protein n=1 Tax=Ptychodera flava TaxID=63121 RepID=UPI00396A639F